MSSQKLILNSKAEDTISPTRTLARERYKDARSYLVPQGSVLGLLLYVLDTAELFHVVARHQLRLHMYADDSQVYITAALNRHCRHRRLDEGQPTTAEPIQDTGYVAGYQTATGLDRHQRFLAAVHRRNSR